MDLDADIRMNRLRSRYASPAAHNIWYRPSLRFDFSYERPGAVRWRSWTPAWLRKALEAARRWMEEAF